MHTVTISKHKERGGRGGWEEGVWWDHFLFGSKRWGRQRKTGHLVYISCKLVSNRWLRFTTSVDKPSNLAENNTSKNCPQRIFFVLILTDMLRLYKGLHISWIIYGHHFQAAEFSHSDVTFLCVQYFKAYIVFTCKILNTIHVKTK